MKQLKNFLHNQKGAVFIETAIITLTFGFLIIALIDFSSVISASLEMSSAMRTGQRYIVSQTSGEANIPQVIKSSSKIPANDVNVTTNQFCECNGAAMALCTNTCAGTKATYMNISMQYSVPLMLNYPGQPNPFPLAKSNTVRIQ